MHDLRKKVLLESGKTESKKSKSRVVSSASSKNASPSVSRNGSRVVSRNASDDEGELSDGTNFSTNSIDDMISSTEDLEGAGWTSSLGEQMDRIVDRKRSSVEGREDTLNRFAHILMAHYSQEEVAGRVGELLPALMKSAKAGASERESVLALKAIALLLITEPAEHIYEAVASAIKQILTDAEGSALKVAAIHTWGVATFYGGASEEETEDVMGFLLSIVASDGLEVDAEDDDEVVSAALEEWGFLATQLEDMEDGTEEAMDALFDQLDSAHVNVQIAAGENIALLYEKSFTELEDDEDPADAALHSDEEDEEVHGKSDAPKMVKRYTVFQREFLLRGKLAELASVSSKRLSKKDKKSLHSNFADILNSVEHPTRGPRYSNAIDQESGKAYGSQMTVGVGGKNVLRIRTWEQLLRLKALRRVLQGGFLTHYSENEVVFDTIPILMHAAEGNGGSGRRKR